MGQLRLHPLVLILPSLLFAMACGPDSATSPTPTQTRTATVSPQTTTPAATPTTAKPKPTAAKPRPTRTTVRTTARPKPPPPPTTSAPARNCDPAYPDVCLRDGIGDYDCAGGSGNGPNYVSGPIRVLPPDPFDLDRDADGIGCE